MVLLSNFSSESTRFRNIDLRLKKLYVRGLKIQIVSEKGTRIEFSIPIGGES